MKATLKKLLWWFVEYGGIYRLVRYRNRNRLLVLTYHGVLADTNGSFLNRNCVSVEMFRRQIEFLRHNYRLLSLEQAIEGIERDALPPYSALVTFDDGYRNNYELAYPVLKAADVPAAIFVTTGMLDRPGDVAWVERVSMMIMCGRGESLDVRTDKTRFRFALDSRQARLRACQAVRSYLKLADSAEREAMMRQLAEQVPVDGDAYGAERYAYMSWDEARELAHATVAIGSHTVEHLCLSSLSDDELREEIDVSRQRIEAETELPCIAVAYPDGTAQAFGERDKHYLREAGFRGAFSQIPGYNAADTDRFALRRFNVPGGSADFGTFVATVAGVRDMTRKLEL